MKENGQGWGCCFKVRDIVDYLKKHSSSLYDYLLKKKKTKRRSPKKSQRILTGISVLASLE
jgi:hypothetical protein